MFLVVTGASGVGKSSTRVRVEADLPDVVTCVELAQVVSIPDAPDERWRQRVVAQIVDIALQQQRDGRHLMLCGDPVPPSEVFAVPEAADIDGGAVLLLDADPAVQSERLARRGDDPDLLPHHLAFQHHLRERAPKDVASRPEWTFTSLDTSYLDADRVANDVLSWARDSLGCAGTNGSPLAKG